MYNRLCIERSPKMGFSGDFGGIGAKIFGGKVHPSSEVRVFRHLWSRSDAPCSSILHGIAIYHRRKFGQVWGSPTPLPEAAGNLWCRKAPLWTFDYHIEKSYSFSDVTPGLYRLVAGRFVLGDLYGENRPKSENWATLSRSSATVRRTEKLTTSRKLPGLALQRGLNHISLQCI